MTCRGVCGCNLHLPGKSGPAARSPQTKVTSCRNGSNEPMGEVWVWQIGKLSLQVLFRFLCSRFSYTFLEGSKELVAGPSPLACLRPALQSEVSCLARRLNCLRKRSRVERWKLRNACLIATRSLSTSPKGPRTQIIGF